MTVRPGRPFLHEGIGPGGLFRLRAGMGLQSITLPDGRRQVTGFMVEGDVVGLEDGFSDSVSRTAEATTQLRLEVFDKRGFLTHLCDNPKRATTLVRLLSASERRTTDHLVTLGQRSAPEAIAWALYCHWKRLDQVNGVEATPEGGVTFAFPYRQRDLADLLGLSLVHTNKTLARLRETHVAQWQGERIFVPDLQNLRAVGGLSHAESVTFA